jgi:PPM family protein phosphatase
MASALNLSESLEYVALTDVGMRRASNQDAHAEVLSADADAWRRRGHLFVVCDGMGAHAAGELASQMAAEGIPHTYLKLRDEPAADAVRKSIAEANNQINARGQANVDFQGMGTTASALVLLPQGALVAHVGDSRVYRLRGKRLDQLTFDHSLVWEMSAAGQVPKDTIPSFVPKNIITRSLGPHPDVQIDLEGPFPLEVGDTFLLCSDGLTGQVSDEEIGAILQCLPPADSAQVLIDLANLRGGPDNITVIVVRVKSTAIAANNGAATEPLALGAEPRAEKAPPPLASRALVVAGVLLLAAVGLAVVASIDGFPATALYGASGLAALVALGLGLFVLLNRLSGRGPELRYLAPNSRLGRGPHVTTECVPDQELVGSLVSMVEQLRDAAMEEHWSVDWGKFDDLTGKGKQAVDGRDYPAAVKHYALALRFMMGELRNQRAAKPA